MATNYYSVYLDSNDGFSAVDHTDFKPTGAFTVGAWVKSASDAGTKVIFSSFAYTGAPLKLAGIWFSLDSHKVYFYTARNTGNTTPGTDYQYIYSNTSVDDGVWHWVVGTWDGAHLKVYVDGNSDATEVDWTYAPVYQATNYIRVGCASSNGDFTGPFTGSLDEVFLINGTAWTSTNVTSYYQKFIIGATNLKAYYQFENGNTDSSGNTHTLTNIDVPVFQINSPFAGDVSTNYLKNYRANTGGRLSF